MEAVLVSSQAIKQATADHPIHPLLEERWSPRAFDAQPVAHAELRSMLEAARWSASGGNKQPWYFIVAERAGEEEFERLVNVLNPANAEWAAAAPVLLLVVAKAVTDDGKPNPYGYYDAGLAVQNLTVQATALGLHVHQMAGFSAERARTAFAIPDGHEPVVALAVGYLGDPNVLSERRREAELAPRTRKPLREFVFEEAWGQPAAFLG